LEGPFYIRLGRPKFPVLFDEDYRFRLGKAVMMRPGRDVTILACGIMVYNTLVAAEILAGEGIEAEVLNVHTIKPLDEEAILASASKTKRVVTCEDHSILGGLGGAVAELLSEKLPVPLRRVGIRDRFGASGRVEELMEHYGLTPRHVAEAARSVLGRAV
jgi:transketolase